MSRNVMSLDRKYRFKVVPGRGLIFESRHYAQKYLTDFIEPFRVVGVTYEIRSESGEFWINEVFKRILDETDLPVVLSNDDLTKKDFV